MIRNLQHAHPEPLAAELRRIYKILDRVGTYLGQERLYFAPLAGAVLAGAAAVVAVEALYGEVAYSATGVRVFGTSQDGDSPTSTEVSVTNVTQSTSTSTVLTWGDGRASADVDLDFNEGDEIAIGFYPDPAKNVIFNVIPLYDSDTIQGELED